MINEHSIYSMRMTAKLKKKTLTKNKTIKTYHLVLKSTPSFGRCVTKSASGRRGLKKLNIGLNVRNVKI